MLNLENFDPTDPNQAMEAAEAGVLLAVAYLQWRAASWPHDSSIPLDGGLAHNAAKLILRYGDRTKLAVPPLYRAALADIARYTL